MGGEILQNKGIEINKELSADEKTAIEWLDLSDNANVKNALLTEKIKIDINADWAIASDNSEGKTMQEIMTEFNDNVEVNPTDSNKLSIIADKDSTAPEWIKKIVDSEWNRWADLAFLITTINKTFLNESNLTPQETFDVQTKTELGNLKNKIEKVDASADVLQESDLNFTLYNGVNLADIVEEVNKITDTNYLKKSDLIALLKTPDIVWFQKALGMAEWTWPEDADWKFWPYTLSVLEKKNDPNVNLYSYDNTNDSNNDTESIDPDFLSLENAKKDPTANHMHIDGENYVPNAWYTWVNDDENNENRKIRLMTKEECLNELDKNHLTKDDKNKLLPADWYDWEDEDAYLNYAVVELN